MSNTQTVGQFFKTIQILHIALCAGVLIPLVLFRYLVKGQTEFMFPNNMPIELFGIAIGFIGVLVSRLLFFMKTKSALGNPSLEAKFSIFRQAFLVQMALLEGAALLNCVLYFITGYDMHFFIGVGILLLMIFRRPTRALAGMVLFHSGEDRQVLYENDRTF
ncbi:MAG TPA: hypothetical protein PLA16_11335 [Chitinophagales bacterium]|jgi:hypothetical protein|nr:hypothetical protein [Chitinophagales bacterium]HQD13051.1 hypothetical protein [Chitinophagales bacterium]HQO30705.1 hypothetical protein [Chitinophagales bacterium]HQO88836.1 hypothetical protein [Chitinophagales bacterium]